MNCHACPICNGYGCIGELPGMGGFANNINFQNNVEGWNQLAYEKGFPQNDLTDYKAGIVNLPNLKDYPVRLGPMTGGVENVGYSNEKQFYFDMISFASSKGISLSIGDGCPDCKLQYGIEAVKNLTTSASTSPSAAVFIKPYPDEKILERANWAMSAGIASHIGIDIDSYNILTMRNQVKLERKSDKQLVMIKDVINKKYDKPFIIKGVFTKYDIDIVKFVKPDIVFISNHGGRVENRIGSTAEFLAENADTLKNYCSEIWVDGGIRTEKDIKLALALGASQVLLGRPVITAMAKEI
ncbi:MAG: alpha-hydroxy-acid oxidizing protein [Treponemataceae bacterium]|nr:alpha-hydroxy-acid oxidizing protein [Spirochaetales bacterium]MDY6032051.1 alpha-hydroxy-acid oxidizing protein [Treponemataceae bacterium]